jgi:hypothetical protein
MSCTHSRKPQVRKRLYGGGIAKREGGEGALPRHRSALLANLCWQQKSQANRRLAPFLTQTRTSPCNRTAHFGPVASTTRSSGGSYIDNVIRLPEHVFYLCGGDQQLLVPFSVVPPPILPPPGSRQTYKVLAHFLQGDAGQQLHHLKLHSGTQQGLGISDKVNGGEFVALGCCLATQKSTLLRPEPYELHWSHMNFIAAI